MPATTGAASTLNGAAQ
ncbi:unnamed protein product [Medioppia subpectinata]|uniref:Uncharacterized protein n=1 Tax=Medioppia subpectinata TaxID=1979941 RepID=A0A7R9L7B4_9ACAR|nr:unnamed protein product [Medioppia subpectinata]CAG2115731.1 unnamed protein product [Medioppia subpectinata]